MTLGCLCGSVACKIDYVWLQNYADGVQLTLAAQELRHLWAAFNKPFVRTAGPEHYAYERLARFVIRHFQVRVLAGNIQL